MISNPPISNLTWTEKKSKDLTKKPDSGMKSKRQNTFDKEEPNKDSTWTYEWQKSDLDLNYFFEKKTINHSLCSIEQNSDL